MMREGFVGQAEVGAFGAVVAECLVRSTVEID